MTHDMDEAPGEHDALQRLCARYGIATDYHDIFGNRHVIAPANLRTLLGSFGVDTGAPLAQSLETAQRALWGRALPPALAIDADAQKWSLVLRLPAALADVGWSLEEENGMVHRGHIDLHAVYESARADLDGVALCERHVELAVPLPMGYHRLRLDGHADEALVIAAPPHCYQPPALQGDGRVWGPALQLYALRSNRNWGIGDFSDLARFAQQAAARGAGIIGLNPLHALFPHNPAHASPYSPSSRLQLDVLYIDVEAVEEFRDCEAAQQRVQSPEFQARLAALRDAELVDYPGVAAAKFEVLALLYRHFCEHGAPAAQQAFEAFREERGEPLRRHALFEALQAHFH
ncbi:MAG: malto-oligosyltrehalose synthase, partial [Variovorax sp.]